jgi:hypothetical protein
VKTYAIYVSRTPKAGAHSPSWPNGLIIIIILAVVRGGEGRVMRGGYLRAGASGPGGAAVGLLAVVRKTIRVIIMI